MNLPTSANQDFFLKKSRVDNQQMRMDRLEDIPAQIRATAILKEVKIIINENKSKTYKVMIHQIKKVIGELNE